MDELANSLGRRRTALLGNKDRGSGGGGDSGRKERLMAERLGMSSRDGDSADKGVKEGSDKIVGLGEYLKSKDAGSGSDDSDWD